MLVRIHQASKKLFQGLVLVNYYMRKRSCCPCNFCSWWSSSRAEPGIENQLSLLKLKTLAPYLSQRQDGQDNPKRRAKPLPRQLPRQQGRKCPFGKTRSRFCEIVRKQVSARISTLVLTSGASSCSSVQGR